MMDSMRNAAKSWVAKLLIGLLAVSFGVWGIADVFRGFNSGALATVGKTEVSAEAFSRAFNNYIQNYSRQTGQALTPEEARRLGIDRAVLNELIQGAAIDNQAEALKLAVSNDYLGREIMDNPDFKDSAGKFDKEQFARLLAQNGLNEAAYFAGERQKLLRDAITGTASRDLAVSRTLVEAQYRHSNEQRDARYFVVKTAESEIVPPTDDEIKAEYDGSPDAYTAPEYRAIAIMKAEPADIAAKIELTAEEIAAGFEKYKTDYFTAEKRTILQLSFPTLEEARAAKDKLSAGTDFLALAKERGFSESDVTFAGKTKADFFDPAIAAAAFALAEGAISEPVKGALATVLLKAVKIAPEHQSTLDEVKPRLSERLKLDRARDEIDSIFGLVEDARGAPDPKFETIAERAGIPFELIALTDSGGKDKDGKDVAMPHQADLLKAAFASDVGNDDDAIRLDEGYVWFEVREVVPSALRPFDSVKEQAKAQVAASKIRSLSEEKVKKLVERAASGAVLEDLAKESQAEIKTVQGLKRNESNADFDPAAVAAVFGVAENGFAYALEADGKGAKLIQSQAVLLAPFDAGSAEAKTITDEIKSAAANDMLAADMGAGQKETGVKINETLWRQIAGTATQ